MKRKIAAVLMTAALVFSMTVLTGCGRNNNDTANQVPDADQNLTNDDRNDGLDDDRLNDGDRTDKNNRDSLGEDLKDGAEDLGDGRRDGAHDVKNGVEDVLDGDNNRNPQ